MNLFHYWEMDEQMLLAGILCRLIHPTHGPNTISDLPASINSLRPNYAHANGKTYLLLSELLFILFGRVTLFVLGAPLIHFVNYLVISIILAAKSGFSVHVTDLSTKSIRALSSDFFRNLISLSYLHNYFDYHVCLSMRCPVCGVRPSQNLFFA